MHSLQEADEASAAVQKTPHRVSLEHLEAEVDHCQYWRPPISPEMTVCAMRLKNGFVLIGKSASADPENFDQELGRKFARDDALRQLWPILGYVKKDELSKS